MLISLGGKLLAYLAKEAVPVILSVLIRNGFRRLKKKIEGKLDDSTKPKP